MQLNFRANAYRCRVYSGAGALLSLPADLKRLGIRRAVILCGNSVARRSSLIDDMRALLGDACVGVFDQSGRHATIESVRKAVAAVRDAQGDGLIAVGAGSVIMGARIVAILLAEKAPLEELVTVYGDAGPAMSARLHAPKLPIVNVLTSATNAQNRAGSALRSADAGHRLEMFDPKTRPASVYWDAQALLTAPPALARAGGLTVFWWSFMTLGGMADANPLSQADRAQSFKLALDALPHVADDRSADARIAMCAAAFLQNRDEDDGGQPFDLHWVFRVCYALGSGIFTLRDDIDPGPVYAALTGPAIEQFGERNLAALRPMCEALGTLPASEAAHADAARLAAAARDFFARVGHTYRLRDFAIDKGALPAIRDFALRNFNADRKRQLRHETARLDATLEAAW